MKDSFSCLFLPETEPRSKGELGRARRARESQGARESKGELGRAREPRESKRSQGTRHGSPGRARDLRKCQGTCKENTKVL